MTGLKAGDEIEVTEHNGGQAIRGGRRYPGRITRIAGVYAYVEYDDKAVFGGRPDLFYADSGWRAWDGEMHWRISRPEAKP